MAKMWAGRFAKELNKKADDFNSSIRFDSRMYKQDITGSMAHAAMLGAQKIISQEDADLIISGLQGVLDDLEAGKLEIDMASEDIHMFVEAQLTARIGDAGKRLHTARSRNDQVAVDIRMYLRDECETILTLLKDLIRAIHSQAEKNKAVIMPGYTHLQRAQPITFGHHLLAYAMMFMRDCGRIEDAVKRMNYSPLGSCALAGTTYNTDRDFEAEKLGFDGICINSIDGVSDRDFCLELMSAFAVTMMHMSRFSEEIILWSSWEFKFIELDDSFTTGSSIMPQKKNSDMAELVRGKTGRVYGNLMAMLTMLKGLPLAYNKDMQEDKEAIFSAVDTVSACLEIFADMLDTTKIKAENMKKSAQKGFINATDVADYLVKKGVPFRDTHRISGEIVFYAIQNNKILEELSLDEFKKFNPLFEEDVFEEISLETCVEKRKVTGSPSTSAMRETIKINEEWLNGKS